MAMLCLRRLTSLLAGLLLLSAALPSAVSAQTCAAAAAAAWDDELLLQSGRSASGRLAAPVYAGPLGPQAEISPVFAQPAGCDAKPYQGVLFDGGDAMYLVPRYNPCFVSYNTSSLRSTLLFRMTGAVEAATSDMGAFFGGVYDREKHRIFLVPMADLAFYHFQPRTDAALTPLSRPSGIQQESDRRSPFGGAAFDPGRRKIWVAPHEVSAAVVIDADALTATTLLGGMAPGHVGFGNGGLGFDAIVFDGRRTLVLIPETANGFVLCDAVRQRCSLPTSATASPDDKGGTLVKCPADELQDNKPQLRAPAFVRATNRVYTVSQARGNFVVLDLTLLKAVVVSSGAQGGFDLGKQGKGPIYSTAFDGERLWMTSTLGGKLYSFEPPRNLSDAFDIALYTKMPSGYATAADGELGFDGQRLWVSPVRHPVVVIGKPVAVVAGMPPQLPLVPARQGTPFDQSGVASSWRPQSLDFALHPPFVPSITAAEVPQSARADGAFGAMCLGDGFLWAAAVNAGNNVRVSLDGTAVTLLSWPGGYPGVSASGKYFTAVCAPASAWFLSHDASLSLKYDTASRKGTLAADFSATGKKFRGGFYEPSEDFVWGCPQLSGHFQAWHRTNASVAAVVDIPGYARGTNIQFNGCAFDGSRSFVVPRYASQFALVRFDVLQRSFTLWGGWPAKVLSFGLGAAYSAGPIVRNKLFMTRVSTDTASMADVPAIVIDTCTGEMESVDLYGGTIVSFTAADADSIFVVERFGMSLLRFNATLPPRQMASSMQAIPVRSNAGSPPAYHGITFVNDSIWLAPYNGDHFAKITGITHYPAKTADAAAVLPPPQTRTASVPPTPSATHAERPSKTVSFTASQVQSPSPTLPRAPTVSSVKTPSVVLPLPRLLPPTLTHTLFGPPAPSQRSITVTVTPHADIPPSNGAVTKNTAPSSLRDTPTGVAVTATGGAVVAAASVTGLVPSAASQPARMMAAARLARCGFDLDDDPPHVEYPWQGPPHLVSASGEAGGEAAAVAALANAGLLTGTLMLAVAAPGLVVLVLRMRNAGRKEGSGNALPAWHRHAVAVATVSCGYFGPSVAAASAALLFRGSVAVGGVLAVLACGVAGLWCSGAVALLSEDVSRPMGTTPSPIAQLQESVTAEVRPQYLLPEPLPRRDAAEDAVDTPLAQRPVPEPSQSLSARAARFYSVIDVGVALVVGAIAGVQPPSGTSQDTCRLLASCAFGVAVVYSAAMLVLRPLRDRLESGLHLAAAVLQVVASLAGLLAAWPEGGDEVWQERLDAIALVSFGVFFSGSVALAARALCFSGKAEQEKTAGDGDTSGVDVVAPLLVVPPASAGPPAAASPAAVNAAPTVVPSSAKQSGSSGEVLPPPAPIKSNPLRR